MARKVMQGDAAAWRVMNACMSRAYDRSKRLLKRQGMDAKELGDIAKSNWRRAKERVLRGEPEVPITEDSLMFVQHD